MVKTDIEIINKLGLHARASSKFTQLASHFKSSIWITRNNRRVNGKSIMGVMMLAAAKGTILTLEVEGEDEEAASTALIELIRNRFNESE